jgi:hypothetical protein
MGGPEEWDRPGGERGLPRPDGDRPAKGHGPTDKPDRDADSRAPRDGFGPPHHPGPGRDDGPAAERRHEGPGGQAGPGQDRAGQEPPEEK